MPSPAGADIFVRSGGSGPVVVLIHGYAETSDSWAPLAADLMADFTVVVPDLRGIGRSSRPAEGTTRRRKRRTSAPWDEIVRNPALWHFSFHGRDPERLVEGRERIYLDRIWNDFSGDPAQPDEDTRLLCVAICATRCHARRALRSSQRLRRMQRITRSSKKQVAGACAGGRGLLALADGGEPQGHDWPDPRFSVREMMPSRHRPTRSVPVSHFVGALVVDRDHRSGLGGDAADR